MRIKKTISYIKADDMAAPGGRGTRRGNTNAHTHTVWFWHWRISRHLSRQPPKDTSPYIARRWWKRASGNAVARGDWNCMCVWCVSMYACVTWRDCTYGGGLKTIVDKCVRVFGKYIFRVLYPETHKSVFHIKAQKGSQSPRVVGSQQPTAVNFLCYT